MYRATKAQTCRPYLRLVVEFDADFSSGQILSATSDHLGLDDVRPEDLPRLEDLIDAEHWTHLNTELACQAPGNAAKLIPMDLSLHDQRGDLHWFNVAVTKLPERGPGAWCIEGWDITRRHREENCRRLSSQLMSILNVDADFEDLAPDVLHYLRYQLQVSQVGVNYTDADGQTVEGCACKEDLHAGALTDLRIARVLLTNRDIADPAPERPFSNGERPPGYEFTRAGSCWTRDLSQLAKQDSSVGPLTEQGLSSLALVPIQVAGSSKGVLAFGDSEPGRFDRDFVELLEELAFAIGNAIHRENIARSVRRSEERYRGLFESSRDGIAIRSLSGRLEAANHAYMGLAHRTLDSLRDIPRAAYLTLAAPGDSGRCYPGSLLRDGFTEDHEMVLMSPQHAPLTVLGREWVISDDRGRPTRAMEILRDISDAKRAEAERQRLVAAIEQADEIVVITDNRGTIQYVNPAFERVTGYTREESLGMNTSILRSDNHDPGFYENLWNTISSGGTWKGRFVNKKKNGDLYQEDATISPILDDSGRIVNFVAVKHDVTEWVALETQLLQAQKLESIGRLAAGIAHEINTPSQYVGDNVHFLGDNMDALMETLAKAVEILGNHPEDEAARKLLEQAADLDLEFLEEEIPSAIAQSQEGLSRITEIVRAMKSFSHPGTDTLELVDIHEAIRGTATVARNEWKYVADLELDFDDELGLVPCLVNEFNQAVLNMIVNAKHAIEEKGLEGDSKGLIRISTRRLSEFAEIRISDSGTGIAPEHLSRIFDPFFTTKAVGTGTGQGLSLSRDIIVGKLGGGIDVESELGVGTTFILHLPLELAEETAEAIQ